MKVFTYGTLMRGHHNHHLLSTSTYLGKAITSDRYQMLDSGFPVLMAPDANDGHQVAGELYECDLTTVAKLDRLEGEGSMYHRVRKQVRINGKSERVYYYVGATEFWKQRGRGYHVPVDGGNLQWPHGKGGA